MYHYYIGDKRKTAYTEYLREKAFDLGLLNINEKIPVTFPEVLTEPRTKNDIYNIISCLQKTMLNTDCIQSIMKFVVSREPLSTREWYMSVYSLIRESKIIPVCCSWYGSSFLGTFHTPISFHRLGLIRTIQNNSWIRSEEETDPLQTIQMNNCYDRVVRCKLPRYDKKIRWIHDEYGNWYKKIFYPLYIPYSIQWIRKKQIFSLDTMERRRRLLILKRLVTLTESSPWIRNECGNRFFFQNKLTGDKQTNFPEEGICNVNIYDIYLYDQIHPTVSIS